MNHRERILTVLRHERPDRIPASPLDIQREVARRLMRHLGVDSWAEVECILGIGGWAGVGIEIDFGGDFEARANGELNIVCAIPTGRYIFHDERTIEDRWGVIHRIGSDGRYVQWVSGPLVEAENPDEYDFPTPDQLIKDPTLPDEVAQLKARELVVGGGVSQPFKTAWQLRGMENVLMDFLLNPRFVERLYDKIYALYGEILRRLTAAGVDMISIGGDIAMQDRLLMGPEVWRRFDKPRLAAAIADCKEINPEVHAKMHSDGDLTAIVPDLIEIGLNVLNPIQPECMDPFQIKELYGDKITLDGCGSMQRTLPYGTVEDVRREVIELIEQCGQNGGLILGPSNTLEFDVPVENIVAFYGTMRDYAL